MSRGLSRDAARKAIVLGFLEPVVARIPLPEAQERLRTLLERKWPEVAPAPRSRSLQVVGPFRTGCSLSRIERTARRQRARLSIQGARDVHAHS